jgi:tetratricopeptide (TPR) repeat protein
MTPELWAQMKEVFSAAMEKPAGEREAFIEEACPDAAVREEVRKLLEAEKRPALEGPIAGKPARGSLPPAIGRYRIIRLLGEGGMGAVYEAEQDQPRRRVALKAIRAGLASPEMLRRFEDEAQALARLHHPGIAQIYEAGAADTGFGTQPYFAMEFIQGASLVRYAEEHRLNMRQRLELMARICEAVHHAHQRGIIHRDLKPANILVDESGQPKIVDFGVARATDLDAQATRQTNSGQILGTLAYMSPEQVLADPLELDTRSDVYALGVILYELLAGRLPYQVSDRLPQAVQTIREEDPAPLSSINRTCRGDVETIAAKALEKDKVRRYSSAAELGADIQRYLRNEPIVARRSTAAYQLRKFARRHRALVAGVAAAFFMLTAGVVASTWEAAQARRAEQEALRQRDRAAAAQQASQAAQKASQKERDRAVDAERAATEDRNRAVAEKQRADNEAATANAIKDFLQNDLLAQANASTQARPGTRPDPNLTVRTALDRAAAGIAGKFDKQPLVEASIRQLMGDTYRQMGLFPEAQRQLEGALALRIRTLGEEHRDTVGTMDALAFLYQQEGKYAQAESLHTKVLEVLRRILGRDHPDTLGAMNDLAVVYQEEGKYALAEPLYREALQAQLRIGEERLETLIVMKDLGDLYRVEGKYALAEPLLRRDLDLQRRVLGEDHPGTLNAVNMLGVLYWQEGRYAEAEPLLVRALADRRRVLGEEHPNTVISMANLGQLYLSQGRYAEAEALFTKTIEVDRRVRGPEHPYIRRHLTSLANLRIAQHRYAEAESILREVLTDPGSEGPDTWRTSERRSLLGVCLMWQSRFAEAEALLISGYRGLVERRSDLPAIVSARDAGTRLLELYDSWGKPEKAAEWRKELESAGFGPR